MKHFILGTAGHVDHGKSSLIEALTKINTDRLPEEKERGLSIDLGFAPLELVDESSQPVLQLGVVDVPGHQKFLRNMIAGVGGFDGALLIVDPNEGVKPQTREHLQILELLDTPRGIVVLTKADRYDEDTLELARWEVAEFLEGTFLEGAEMVATSAHSGLGLEELKKKLIEMFRDVPEHSRGGVARLPVDRVFSKTGFGAVVTGSLWSGLLEVGSEVEVLPQGKSGKIRGIHVHGKSTDQAVPGQRVAVNFSGLDTSDLSRGTTVVSPPGSLPTSERFAFSLTLQESQPKFLAKKFRATFFQATGHATVSLNLVADDDSSVEVFGQMLFSEERLLCKGDRFLLRDETDSYLIGGGTILGLEEEPFRRRQRRRWLRRYQALAGGGEVGSALQALREKGGYCKESALRKQLGISPKDWGEQRAIFLASGRIRALGKDKFYLDEDYQELANKVQGLLKQLQDAAPWKPGWRPEELSSLLGQKSGRDQGFVDVLEDQVFTNFLQRQGPVYSLQGHSARLGPSAEKQSKALVKLLQDDGFSPRDWAFALAHVSQGDKKLEKKLEDFLLGTGQLVRITEKIVIPPVVLEQAKEKLKSIGPGFSASEAKTALDTSRKYIIPYLEWMDLQGWTHRKGDTRQIL